MDGKRVYGKGESFTFPSTLSWCEANVSLLSAAKKWRGKKKAMGSFTGCQRFIAVKTQCRQKHKQCQHSIPAHCNSVCRIQAAVNHWTFTETRLPFGNHSLQWFHTTQLQLEQGEGSSAWLKEGLKCDVIDINPRGFVKFLCVWNNQDCLFWSISRSIDLFESISIYQPWIITSLGIFRWQPATPLSVTPRHLDTVLVPKSVLREPCDSRFIT